MIRSLGGEVHVTPSIVMRITLNVLNPGIIVAFDTFQASSRPFVFGELLE